MKYEITRPNTGRSLFDTFFGDRFYDNLLVPSLGETSELSSWRPAVDIVEKEDKYIIKADVPGVDEKDISIEVKDGILTLKGERYSDTTDENDNVYRCERSYGSFMRNFKVTDVNEDKITAEFKKGILTIELPKEKNYQAKKISIKTS